LAIKEIISKVRRCVKIRPMIEESLALSREIGDRGLASFGGLFLSGIIAFFQGEQTRSRSLFEESLAQSRKTGNQRGIAGSLFGLGMLAFAQSDAGAAQALLVESLEIWRTIENQPMMASCLENLAAVVVVQGQARLGVQLWGAVEMLREGSGIRPTPPAMSLFYEQVMANTRASLGEEAFVAAWNEGRTMPLDEVINEVLRMGHAESDR